MNLSFHIDEFIFSKSKFLTMTDNPGSTPGNSIAEKSAKKSKF